MSARFVVGLTLVLASACTDRGTEAEDRYRIVEKDGTLGEVCDAANAVANAYLEDKKEDGYRLWSAIAGVRCMTADQLGRHLPAQDEDRQKLKAEVDAVQRDAMEAARHAADEL